MADQISILMKYMTVIAIVAMFTTFLGFWRADAPQIVGWSEFISTLKTDPRAGLPDFPVFQPPQQAGGGQPCNWWDAVCHATNIGNDITRATSWIGSAIFFIASTIVITLIYVGGVLFWAANLVTRFFIFLFSAGSLTFDNMPTYVQLVLWVIVIPFWAFLVLFIIDQIRRSIPFLGGGGL